MILNPVEFEYIGRCLEAFFFGLYSAIFFLYLEIEASSRGTKKGRKKILLYALCVLYALSLPIIMLDAMFLWQAEFGDPNLDIATLQVVEVILFGCCDFIAQSILIYRCWIVWGHSTNNYIRCFAVVIIPPILAFTFLVFSIVGGIAPRSMLQSQYIPTYSTTDWGDQLLVTGLTLSIILNALVTGLIAFRIFQILRQVNVQVTRGRKYWSVMFIVIESGITLFSFQLVRLVVGSVTTSVSASDWRVIQVTGNAYSLIYGIHQMLNGITPTIILVRVSMGLSFRDEDSMAVEASIGTLQFAPNDPETISEERRDDEDWHLSLGDDPNSNSIQMVPMDE